MVLKSGHWYLVAGTQGRARTFRVSNVLEASILDQGFERPPGFDLATYWRSYLADYDARRHIGHAVVRVSAAGRRRLGDLWPTATVRAAEASAGLPDERGWTELTIPVEPITQAIPEILKLGADIEVINPPALRSALINTASDLHALYGSDVGDSQSARS